MAWRARMAVLAPALRIQFDYWAPRPAVFLENLAAHQHLPPFAVRLCVGALLNRAPKRLDITPGELEKMLGTTNFATVPNDYPELYETYAEGRMLSRTCELGKQSSKLALKLANLEEEQAVATTGKKRWFGETLK